MRSVPVVSLVIPSLLFLVLAVSASTPLQPEGIEPPQSEKEYQKEFASKVDGKVEVRMGDGTRCDVVTKTHAIEVDFGHKWAEAIGQSLHYAFQSNKKAGIALILKTKKDYRYLIRLKSVIKHYELPIEVWPVYGYRR